MQISVRELVLDVLGSIAAEPSHGGDYQLWVLPIADCLAGHDLDMPGSGIAPFRVLVEQSFRIDVQQVEGSADALVLDGFGAEESQFQVATWLSGPAVWLVVAVEAKVAVRVRAIFEIDPVNSPCVVEHPAFAAPAENACRSDLIAELVRVRGLAIERHVEAAHGATITSMKVVERADHGSAGAVDGQQVSDPELPAAVPAFFEFADLAKVAKLLGSEPGGKEYFDSVDGSDGGEWFDVVWKLQYTGHRNVLSVARTGFQSSRNYFPGPARPSSGTVLVYTSAATGPGPRLSTGRVIAESRALAVA